MLIEKYSANPGANDFSYVTVTLDRPYKLVSYFVHSETNVFTGYVFVYRGTINAYNTANAAVAVMIERWQHAISGAAYYYAGPVNPCRMVNIELPAGTYTFAVYTVPDTTCLRWVFFLA